MKTIQQSAILALLLFLACLSGLKKYSESFFAMDSIVEVTFFTSSKSEGEDALREMKEECRRIEDKFGVSKEGSEVHKINRRIDRSRFVTDSEVAGLVSAGLRYGEETGGRFDITLGPVKWLWGLGSGQTPAFPDTAKLRETLSRTGFRKVSVRGDTLFFSDTAIRIDLGGIAQGYALTRLQAILKRHGITSFMVNVSGDIMIGDPKPDGKPWVIGVRHPRKPGELLKKISLHNTCIITSGDYERFFLKDSVRYHHIFNPKTGFPAKGVISATVVADDPLRADVYSTMLVVKGTMEKDSLPGIRQYLVLNEGLQTAEFP